MNKKKLCCAFLILILILTSFIVPVYANNPVKSFEEQEAYFRGLFNNNTTTFSNSSEEKINMLVSGLEDNNWHIEFSPKDISAAWNNKDHIEILDFDYMDICYNESGSLTLSCSEDKYQVGDTIKLVILNNTKNTQKELFINFSNAEIPTFSSWAQAAPFVNSVKRAAFSDKDVIVDATLQESLELDEETINAFHKSSFDAEEPIDFGAVPEEEELDLSLLDNSGRFLKATLDDSKWVVRISPSDLSDQWSEDDMISVPDFPKMEAAYDHSVLVLTANESQFPIGKTIILSVLNSANDEYGEIFVNFTDRDKLLFNSDEEAALYGVFDNSLYDIFYDTSAITPYATTSATRYKVYASASSTNPVTNIEYKSPFAAIQYTVLNGANGWNVRQSNDGVIIFNLNRSSGNTFSKFQFTYFYGTTTDVNAARNWTIGFDKTHAVRNDGIFAANTAKTDSQPNAHHYNYYKNTPPNYMLEGTTGGYVYSLALSYAGYRSMAATVLLSGAQVYQAAGVITNPYVYMNATNNYNGGSYGCDLGLIYIDKAKDPSVAKTGWYLTKSPSYGTLTVKNKNSCFSVKEDIDLTLRYQSGLLMLEATNKSIRVFDTIIETGSWVSPSEQYIGLMAATTLVPAVATTNGMKMVSDIKGGSYLRNVTWNNLRVYTSSAATGTAYYINPTGAATSTVIVYDTDSCQYVPSGNNHTVNIGKLQYQMQHPTLGGAELSPKSFRLRLQRLRGKFTPRWHQVCAIHPQTLHSVFCIPISS